MLQLSGLVLWDLALFGVILAAGLLLYLLSPRKKEKQPLSAVYGRRLMGASLLFLPGALLDSWKPGAGVLLAAAGMAGILTWCMVTLCQRLDDTTKPR